MKKAEVGHVSQLSPRSAKAKGVMYEVDMRECRGSLALLQAQQ
jgi:hypothetical protein